MTVLQLLATQKPQDLLRRYLYATNTLQVTVSSPTCSINGIYWPSFGLSVNIPPYIDPMGQGNPQTKTTWENPWKNWHRENPSESPPWSPPSEPWRWHGVWNTVVGGFKIYGTEFEKTMHQVVHFNSFKIMYDENELNVFLWKIKTPGFWLVRHHLP